MRAEPAAALAAVLDVFEDVEADKIDRLLLELLLVLLRVADRELGIHRIAFALLIGEVRVEEVDQYLFCDLTKYF